MDVPIHILMEKYLVMQGSGKIKEWLNGVKK